MPEVWFPGSTPLGRWVNRGTSSLSSFLDCEGIPRRAALVSAKSYFAAQRPRPQPTKEMATEVKEEVSAGQSYKGINPKKITTQMSEHRSKDV